MLTLWQLCQSVSPSRLESFASGTFLATAPGIVSPHVLCVLSSLPSPQKQTWPAESQSGPVPTLPHSVDSFFIVDKVARVETVSCVCLYLYSMCSSLYYINYMTYCTYTYRYHMALLYLQLCVGLVLYVYCSVLQYVLTCICMYIYMYIEKPSSVFCVAEVPRGEAVLVCATPLRIACLSMALFKHRSSKHVLSRLAMVQKHS